MTGPFAAHARNLIINGYSPIPIRPGEKRPLGTEWETLRDAPISEEQIREVIGLWPKAGIGVAGGFNGLVPIDVDTDDEAIRIAVRKALPAPVVVKKGKRGATAFYRCRLPITGRKFKDAEGKAIVEVLTTVQTVIPPTTHPGTGKPYRWTTPATLLDTCIDDLSEITLEHLAVLQQALRPWLAPPRAHRPHAFNGNGHGARKSKEARLRAYAAAALDGEAKQLARTGAGGRNHGLFAAVCRLGNYVHHKVLSHAEVHAALLDACNANGFNKEHGGAAFEKTFAKGLQWSEDDELREPPPGKEQPQGDAHNPQGESKPDPADWRSGLIMNPAGQPKALLANAIIALRDAPEWREVLRFDEFALAVTADGPPWTKGRTIRWSDGDAIRAADWLQHQGIAVSVDTAHNAAMAVAQGRPFHPVRNYLNTLKWDGTPRLADLASKYLGAEDCEYVREVGLRFMVSAVARIMQPGCKADHMLILEGQQGALKSTAAQALVGERWFTDELPELGTKDAAMQTAGVWVIEVAELHAMTMKRAEVERVKAFISRTTDRFRPPFGRTVQSYPRQCVFIGTTNAETYLKDETGGRRFWPIRCGAIDVATIKRDRDQLWAEAVHWYRQGERWWLDKGGAALASEEQDQRFAADPWQALIASYLDQADPQAGVSVQDILGNCLSKPRESWTQLDQNRVAACLMALGWEKYRPPTPRGGKRPSPRYRPRDPALRYRDRG
jgi:predicted P-loop ATPase